MKRFFAFAMFLIGAASYAQIPSGFVQTKATVPSLAGGQFGASWTNLSSSSQLGLLGGVSTFQTTVNGTLDANGSFSTLLADPGQIIPQPDTWSFSFSYACPAGSPSSGFALQLPMAALAGFGGGTVDISSQITAALPTNPCNGTVSALFCKLTGCTLTGPLNGTSATFSGTVATTGPFTAPNLLYNNVTTPQAMLGPLSLPTESVCTSLPCAIDALKIANSNVLGGAASGRNMLSNDVNLATTFVDEPDNPLPTQINVESSIILEGGICYMWGTGYDGNTWLESSPTCFGSSSWTTVGSSPVLVGYRFSSVFKYSGTYYMLATPNTAPVPPASVHLFTSSNKTSWVDHGVVCAHSSVSTDWNYNLFNTSATVVGSTIWFFVEATNASNISSLGMASADVSSLPTPNFNTNLTKIIDNNNDRDVGLNPFVTYVPDRNALMVGFEDRSNPGTQAPGGAAGMLMITCVLSNNCLSFPQWTPAQNFTFWKWEPGYGNGNYSAMATDGFVLDLTGQGKAHNLLFTYNWAQQVEDMGHSDLTLDQFYDAVTTQAGTLNVAKQTINMRQFTFNVFQADGFTPIFHYDGSDGMYLDARFGFKARGTARPFVNSTLAGFPSEMNFNNTGDADTSWAAGRGSAKHYLIEYDTANSFGNGLTSTYVDIDPATGTFQSVVGGFKFPDNSVQTTAATSIITTGTWTPTSANLTCSAGCVLSGTWKKVGPITAYQITISASGTSSATTTTTLSLPATPTLDQSCTVSDTSNDVFTNSCIARNFDSKVHPGVWTTLVPNITISGFYW